MPRRSKSDADVFADELFETFMVAPAWLGPLFAVAAFFVLTVIWPALFIKTATPLAGIGPTLAPFVAVGVLVIWGIAEFKKRQRRRLLNTTFDLNQITWQEFELLVGEAYRRQGYAVTETGKASGDGGYDLVLERNNQKVLVQCKHWRTKRVGVQPVRELYGVLVDSGAHRALLVTGGNYTSEARRFAKDKPLELIAGDRLQELMKAGRAGQKVERPTTAPQETKPSCPICTSPMVKRTAKRGPNPGSEFWGCPSYPRCNGTRPA